MIPYSYRNQTSNDSNRRPATLCLHKFHTSERTYSVLSTPFYFAFISQVISFYCLSANIIFFSPLYVCLCYLIFVVLLILLKLLSSCSLFSSSVMLCFIWLNSCTTECIQYRYCDGHILSKCHQHRGDPSGRADKAWVYGRSLSGTVGSNPFGGTDVCLLGLLCVVRKRGLCFMRITRPEEFCRVSCIWMWLWSLNNYGIRAR
jgi:hypothetical protein